MSDLPEWEAFRSQTGLVEAFVGRAGGLLSELSLTGLDRPEGDLRERLADLALRADGLGMGAGAARLRALGGALGGDPLAVRTVAFQTAVAWWRGLKAELDLLLAEAALDSVVSAPAVEQAGPGFHGEVDIVGIEPGANGSWLLWGQVVGQEGFVTIREEIRPLAKRTPAEPLRAPSASRMLQDRCVPAEILRQRWVFKDQPMSRQAGVVVLRSAFSGRPALTPSSTARPLPELRDAVPGRVAGPVRCRLALADGDSAVRVVGLESAFAPSPLVVFNLKKARVQALDPWFRVVGPGPELVGADDGIGDLALPQLDPTWASVPVPRWVEAVKACPRGIAGLWLRAGLGRLQVPVVTGSFLEEAEGARPRGLWWTHRRAWLLEALGEEPVPADLALGLEGVAAFTADPDRVALEAVATLLGTDPERTFASDRARLDDRALFAAVRIVAGHPEAGAHLKALALGPLGPQTPLDNPWRAAAQALAWSALGDDAETSALLGVKQAQETAWETFLRMVRKKGTVLPEPSAWVAWLSASLSAGWRESAPDDPAWIEMVWRIGWNPLERLLRGEATTDEALEAGGDAAMLVGATGLGAHFVAPERL